MTLVPSYHPDAAEELVEAAAFYEGHREDLGIEFIDAVDSALRRACRHPERFLVVHTTPRGVVVRRARLATRRFRYILIFATLEDTLTVLAVAHTSRKPGYWLSRLADTR